MTNSKYIVTRRTAQTYLIISNLDENSYSVMRLQYCCFLKRRQSYNYTQALKWTDQNEEKYFYEITNACRISTLLDISYSYRRLPLILSIIAIYHNLHQPHILCLSYWKDLSPSFRNLINSTCKQKYASKMLAR